MADDILKRDENSVTVLAGVTDDANAFIKMLPIDPITGRLKVSATLSASNADAETPTATANPAVFTLTEIPSPAASLMLFRNGMLQAPGAGNDFVLSSSTITLAAALGAGEVLLAWYRY